MLQHWKYTFRVYKYQVGVSNFPDMMPLDGWKHVFGPVFIRRW